MGESARTKGGRGSVRRQVGVTTPDPETLHRTLKLELDSGRAKTLAEAEKITTRYRLHIDAGPLAATSSAAQAALVTATATAVRAFLGGVTVRVAPGATLLTTWKRGSDICDVLRSLGASVVHSDETDRLTLAVGHAAPISKSVPVLYASVDGWVARVASSPLTSSTVAPQPLAGVLAGAVAVAELFQHARGDVRAGRRDVVINLWSPNGTSSDQGPAAPALPGNLWMVGLGHLGQAYAWVLAMLPFENPHDVVVQLQDTDIVSPANISTGLFSHQSNIGFPKTRVVAAALEDVGFRTRLIERRFDEHTRPQPDDPTWLLAGLDDAQTRRWLHAAAFDRYLDAGIGDRADTYLDIVVQTFPSQQNVEAAFPPLAPRRVDPAPAYERLAADAIATGADPGAAQCGVIELAGRAVGAAFVGATAACLAFADVLRALNGSQADMAVLNFDLRDPTNVVAAANTAPGPANNPGYTTSRPLAE